MEDELCTALKNKEAYKYYTKSVSAHSIILST